MLKGSIMQMICQECGAEYYMFGDFLHDEGRFVRACEVPWQECKKCTIIHEEFFDDAKTHSIKIGGEEE